MRPDTSEPSCVNQVRMIRGKYKGRLAFVDRKAPDDG